MHVFTLEISILIDDAFSLKDKRRIVKSIVERSQHRYKVSAAEIGKLDMINQADLAFALVSNSVSHGHNLMSKLLTHIEESYPIMVTEYQIEEH